MSHALSSLVFLSLVACGPGVSGDDDDDDTTDDAGWPDGGWPDASGIDADEPDFSRVYGHSATVLYRLDTSTLTPIQIGAFANTGTQGITDIAIDKNDRMLGITRDKIYDINIATGAATLLTALVGIQDLTSLSFVPMDLNIPNGDERLVAAASDGTVYEINQTTGAATTLGSYGSTGGEVIGSSGDIVAIAGFGIFATVNIGSTTSDFDYLAEINPSTWRATPKSLATGFDRIFGLGFWRGKIYGFVDRQAQGGAIIEIAPTTGAGSLVNSGAVNWFGAGVTTDAPVID